MTTTYLSDSAQMLILATIAITPFLVAALFSTISWFVSR